jgi:hypothetical protein
METIVENFVNNRIVWILWIAICLSARVVAQEQIVNMDNEPHYSRVFSNEYCRAYIARLGRLEETKPVVHEHDWVRMTLNGTVEQAFGGTLYASAPYEDPEGYVISFLFPVSRVSLRNPRNDPYRAMIVEIMQGDDSRNRVRDPSLAPFAQKVGPGVDPHVSYVTTLTKTSVEILNVQLLSGDSRDLHSTGVGALMVAMTDLNLLRQQDGQSKELRLSKGEVQWFPGAAPAFKNPGKEPARFVLLEMK